MNIKQEKTVFMTPVEAVETLRSEDALCFTGHRHFRNMSGADVCDRLADAVCEAYDRGIRSFIAGGALGFDTLAAEAVLSLRRRCPDIRLTVVTPCYDQEAKWKPEECRRYYRILELADAVICLSREYTSDCMLVRNRVMVDASSEVIAYMEKSQFRSGTRSTVSYANKTGKRVVNLSGEG